MATSTGAPLSTDKPEGTDVASTAIKTTIAAAIQAINDYVALDCKNILTTAGDTVYASAAKTLARLAKGTARQQLAMNSGATAPEWVASLQSLMTAEGDVLYASAANTPARLAKGTADQLLRMNSGATAPEWASTLAGLTLTAPTIGDFTNANHAHLAAGSGGQLDHGTALTGLTDDDHTQYQLKSLLTTQGDIPYATAASTWARLAKGTAGQVLVMNPGATAPEWGSVALANLLVNGGFEVWQRGAGAFTADGAYTADRWVMDEVGTDAFSVTREGTTKKTNSLYSLAAAFTLGDSGTSQIYQRLTIGDGHHGLLGQAISLRLPVKLLAGVASAVKAFITTDGTGGTTTYSSVHGNNTDWEDLDVANLTVPSDATYIQVGLEFAQSCTAYLDNAMLRLATTAANFAPLTPAEEWVRCERYYEIQGGAANDMYQNVYAAGANWNEVFISFVARKAAVPTVTKAGTWTVTNSGQPAVEYPTYSGYSFAWQPAAAGAAVVRCADSTTYISAEANP